jgi:hypothetical protein
MPAREPEPFQEKQNRAADFSQVFARPVTTVADAAVSPKLRLEYFLSDERLRARLPCRGESQAFIPRFFAGTRRECEESYKRPKEDSVLTVSRAAGLPSKKD